MKITRVLTGATCACGLLLSMAAPAQAALIRGTGGPDNLVGTRFADRMLGRHGDDVLRSLRGFDEVWGQGEADRLELGYGDDYGNGGPGSDVVMGGPGADVVVAGRGLDSIFGGPGADRLWSGRGSTTMTGADGKDQITMEPGDHAVAAGDGADVVRVFLDEVETPETIRCGPGQDTVRYLDAVGDLGEQDPTDTLVDCETIQAATP